MSELKRITQRIKIVQTPITFESLEMNASFSYDSTGKELLTKMGKQKAAHINEQRFVKVESETLVYRVFL